MVFLFECVVFVFVCCYFFMVRKFALYMILVGARYVCVGVIVVVI